MLKHPERQSDIDILQVEQKSPDSFATLRNRSCLKMDPPRVKVFAGEAYDSYVAKLQTTYDFFQAIGTLFDRRRDDGLYCLDYLTQPFAERHSQRLASLTRPTDEDFHIVALGCMCPGSLAVLTALGAS